MCTNGSGTNSVKPPVRVLQVADAQQMPRPMPGPLDMAEHDRRRRAQAAPMRRLDDIEPFLCRELVGAERRANLVVENLGRGSGQAAEARVAQPVEKVADVKPEARAPCCTSSGENACT